MKKNKGYLIVGFDGEQYFTPFSLLPLVIGKNDRSKEPVQDSFTVIDDLQTTFSAITPSRIIAEVEYDDDFSRDYVIAVTKLSKQFTVRDLLDVSERVQKKFLVSNRTNRLYFGVPTSDKQELEQYLESLIF